MSDSTKSAKRELNAFEELMKPKSKKQKTDQSTDEPIYMAVIYIRWLLYVDPSEPLFGCPYVGQAVRFGNSAIKVAKERWKEENRKAVREDKDLGLIHCLGLYGSDVFKDEVVEWKRGPRSEVHKWANEREIAIIEEFGGPLKDPTVHSKQTLNLTKGGQRNVKFEARDALRNVAWLKFVSEMNEYVECYGTSLVPKNYVNQVSGHRLGEQLNYVRQGKLWKSYPGEDEKKKWLESLPGWAWKAKETHEWKDAFSKRKIAEWANLDEETRAERTRKNKESHSTSEARSAASERKKAHWANKDNEGRVEWGRKISEGKQKPENKALMSKRAKEQALRESANGIPSLAKRAQEWRKNATSEELNAIASKIRATLVEANTKRREDVLSKLTGVALERKKKEYERHDRKEKTRKAKADALLKLEKYAGMDYQWRYRNVSKVQKEDGVHFFQDANGVWCAAFKTQGEGSSSGTHTEAVDFPAEPRPQSPASLAS